MANANSTLSKSYLLSLFYYKDGNIYYKSSNKLAGSNHYSGYKNIKIAGKSYMQHRIIFMMHYGFIPNQIDHINGIKDDNQIENLREATGSQNSINRKTHKTNLLGIKNVKQQNNKFIVRIHVDGKSKYIGSFDDIEFADLVAQEARAKYHGKFARNF